MIDLKETKHQRRNRCDHEMVPIRMKRDKINELILVYLRHVLKQSFFDQDSEKIDEILLTEPCDLEFEKYIFGFYEEILKQLRN